MVCGTAKKKITPPENLLPLLHGLGNITFSAVLDDIYVRVLVLDDERKKIMFVVFDLDKVPWPEKYLPMLAAQTGIPEECISLLSTHTHTAPIAGWRPTEGPNFILKKPEIVQKAISEYEEFLERVVREAVNEAIELLQPVRIGWGQGESYVNINRVEDYIVRNEDGSKEVYAGLGHNYGVPVDRNVYVLKVEDLAGRMVACMINYAVHNCVMIGNRCADNGGTLLSSDLGGNVSRMIEENYPGCVALWTSGAAGDVNPIMMNQIFYPDPQTGAQAVYQVPVGDTTPLIMLKVLSARHYADVARLLERIACENDMATLDGAVKWLILPSSGKQPYQIRVHLSRIGEFGLWGVSGELYSSIGEAVTRSLPNGRHLIMSHDASLIANSGYIFDDEAFVRDRYKRLPGWNHNDMMPGYAKEALLKITAVMWEEATQEEEKTK